ncbi:TIGR03086 family metal-binding protein [Amycolatopsis sp. SID8362]|uniref:TIGR03086 family metal-binding protein n=1 Tax=Amycolatopsis sp. SID8362 TaxID=2690346 RepID=UPI0013711E7F|nr:TIGR03086 family metal-binding protein [Amycolatopsis sp. SID8362]NBH11053.1 TIGR03086 family protein [Amycolatopsis sp. SID8362]NED47744.1 TIGR03086 family protein [Amycolatopsis sp. SID8362]
MLLDRYLLASKGFEDHLRAVPAGGWHAPTPCTEWDVRALVNHMTRGNLNYVGLLGGATREEFLAARDADALGADPVTAFTESVRACADALAGSGVLDRVVDYPLGELTGRRALAVRTADSTVHTWDLARALGRDETLDPGLVAWLDEDHDAIFAGLELNSRVFAAPLPGESGEARQDRVLRRFGRDPRSPAGRPAR